MPQEQNLEIEREVREEKIIGPVDRIVSNKDGLFGSTINEDGLFGSTINGDVGSIEAGENGLWRSTINGDVGSIEAIESGLNWSTIDGNISSIEAGDDGLHSNSTINGNVGSIDARGDGLWRSTINGNVGSIEAGRHGLGDSTINGNVGSIDARGDGLWRSTINGDVGSLEAGEYGLYNSKAKSIISIEAGDDGLHDNSIIEGDIGSLEAGKYGLCGNSKVHGIIGNVKVGEVVLSNSHFIRIVGEEVSGETLDKNSHGGLIAADNVSGKYNGGLNVITPQNDERFITYTGENWEEAKEELRNLEETKALSVFKIERDEIGSLDELLEIEEELESYLGDLSYEQIRKDWDYTKDWNELNNEHFGQLLQATSETIERVKKKSIEEFGEKLDRGTKQNLVEKLETYREEHKPGKDIVRIAKNRKYSSFLNNEDSRIREILGSREKVPEVDSELEDSPYRELLERIYGHHEEELQETAGLAREVRIDFSTNLESLLKKWEWQRENQDREVELDFRTIKSLVKNFRKELQTKRRDYTIKALQNMGKREVQKIYEEATGEQKDRFTDNEIEALRAYKNHRKNRRAISKLLRNSNEVYNLPENSEWLDRRGFDLERLTNFEYRTTNIDKENAEKNVEERKSELWQEIQELLGQFNQILGTDYRAESIEDFERLREETELPNNKEARRLYKEMFKEKPNEYLGLDSQLEGVPGSLIVRVASPIGTIQMGNHFTNSCLATHKSNGWAVATNAVDVNKQVLYAYDEEEKVVGRVLTGITDDHTLTYFRTYSNTEADLEPAMREAAIAYGNHLGLEVEEGNKNISTLESEEWYSGNI